MNILVSLVKQFLRVWVLSMAVGAGFLTAGLGLAADAGRPTETPEQISQKLLGLDTRREAANSLKNHDAAFRREVAKLLIQALNTGNSSKQLDAMFAIQSVGQDAEEAIPVLTGIFLADKDGLGHPASQTLGKLGARAAPVLVEKLKDPANQSPLGLARVVDEMAPVPRELLPGLVEALRIYASGYGGVPARPDAGSGFLRRAFERFDRKAVALEIAGHVASAIAKTDPGCIEAVPLIKQGHDRTWNPIVNQGLGEALEKMTSPEAKSLAWKLRAKRRLFIFVCHAPFLILYGWLIYRLYRWVFRRGLVLRYVLMPVVNNFMFLYIAIFAGLGGEFYKSVSSPGVAISYPLTYILYSPIMIAVMAPVYFAAQTMAWSMMGLIPWLKKSRPLGLLERGFCVITTASFLLLVGWMIWAHRISLNIPVGM